MRSLKLKDSDRFYSQEVLDFNQNILLRLYHLENGYGFRYIAFENGVEVDPIKNSGFDWVYGPIKCVEEAKETALDLYKTLIQK